MRTKKFESKLVLNKKTVADLNKKEMSEVKGGYYTGLTCQTNLNCTAPKDCEYGYTRPFAACPTNGKLSC